MKTRNMVKLSIVALGSAMLMGCELTDSDEMDRGTAKAWVDLQDVGISLPLDEKAIAKKIDDFSSDELVKGSLDLEMLALDKIVWESKPGAKRVKSMNPENGNIAMSSNTSELKAKVPIELSPDPNDPDWFFEGYSTPLQGKEKTDYETAVRLVNKFLEKLPDSKIEEFKEMAENARKAWMTAQYESLGEEYDTRDDLFVTETLDGQIWRKKKPIDYQADEDAGVSDYFNPPYKFGDSYGMQVSIEELREQINRDIIEEEEQTKNVTAFYVDKTDEYVTHGAPEIVAEGSGGDLSNDYRELNSSYNGHDMGDVPWISIGAFFNSVDEMNGDYLSNHCTGGKIGPRLVLTAGHCLFEGGSWTPSTQIWAPGYDGIARYKNGSTARPNGYKDRSARYVTGNWHDHEWYYEDMGIFVLRDNDGSCNLPSFGWYNYSFLDGDYVYGYGYPAKGKDGVINLCYASPRPDKRCGSSNYGTGDNIQHAYTSTIILQLLGQPGQSGTPVYKKISSTDRKVVAVFTGPYYNQDRAVRINNDKEDFIYSVHSIALACRCEQCPCGGYGEDCTYASCCSDSQHGYYTCRNNICEPTIPN